MSDGSERRNWKYDEDSSEHWYWWVMALNAEQRCDDGSEHRYWEAMVALNTEQSEAWLWTPNEAKHGSERRKEWRNGSKRRNEVDNSLERQTKQSMTPNVGINDVMALNAKREYDFECQTEE